MTHRGPPGHLTRPSRGAFFPAASGKLLLSLPAAQVPTRISPPRHQANAAGSQTLLPTMSRGLPLPQCLNLQSFSSSLGLSSPSRLIASTCCRFCRLCRFRRRCRFQHHPSCLNQRCFVSVSPRRLFLPGLDGPTSSPCSSNNLRCRFPPLLAWLPSPQCPDQQSSPSSLGLSSPEIPGTLPDRVPASATPCPWTGSGGRIRATWG